MAAHIPITKEETEYKKIETTKMSMGILNLISLHLGNFLGNISELVIVFKFLMCFLYRRSARAGNCI